MDALESSPGLYDRPTVVGIEILFGQGAGAVDFGNLPIGAIVTKAWCDVITAFNAVTTNVIEVGHDGNIAAYLAAGDVTEGTPGVTPANGKGPFAAETAARILRARYTQTGTPATTGRAFAYVEYVRPR